MDAAVSSELVAIGDGLLRFIAQEVEPLERANKSLLENERYLYDEAGRFSPPVLELRRDVRRKSAAAGYYNMFGPEELGGMGYGPAAAVYINELLSADCGPARPLIQTVVLPSPFTNGLSPVLRHLDPAVRAPVLVELAAGEKTMCFGLSEPDAGSDVYAMRSRAMRDGGDWLLTGTKQWITNGPYADYAMIFAVTDADLAARRKGGITGFFVDTKAPGFSAPATIPYLGHLGSEIGILNMDSVRVPDRFRLGEVNQGLRAAMGGVNIGRLGLAAGVTGMARWGLKQAIDYAKVRRTFGRPIGDYQAIQFLLADSATEIYAAKSMLFNCARKLELGDAALKEVSMAKLFCTEMANRVLDRCIQVHGAMGLTNELRLEAAYRFARSMRIPDGTSEIQRRTIALQLLGGETSL